MVPLRKKTAAWIWLLLPTFVIIGLLYPIAGFAMLICMIAPVVVATVRGRHWCGWLCPRGAFYDAIMTRLGRHPRAPAWLRSMPFRVTIIVFLMGMMGVQMTLAWPNLAAMGRVFVNLLVITTMIGIVLAAFFPARTWCSFCPMGTLASWVATHQRPLHVASNCRNCAACAKVCPMSLTPHKADASQADCLRCTACVARCPVSALSYEPQPKVPEREKTIV